jgi:hypothetical protein
MAVYGLLPCRSFGEEGKMTIDSSVLQLQSQGYEVDRLNGIVKPRNKQIARRMV